MNFPYSTRFSPAGQAPAEKVRTCPSFWRKCEFFQNLPFFCGAVFFPMIYYNL
ncbi:hypothetical protein HMPREF1545_04152 [Oscillibacter sp. KLE 1728]|nr:hypothetical protein HMPREF1545_04152 [Oscillibacter sp. KLE 1728]ERK61418.1 hypothetical protein HMPREF1546_03108 [Oscillibacter sp. KLE 1745]